MLNANMFFRYSDILICKKVYKRSFYIILICNIVEKQKNEIYQNTFFYEDIVVK